jgi:hypothetical protein
MSISLQVACKPGVSLLNFVDSSNYLASMLCIDMLQVINVDLAKTALMD